VKLRAGVFDAANRVLPGIGGRCAFISLKEVFQKLHHRLLIREEFLVVLVKIV
jgi:hypothetical protein